MKTTTKTTSIAPLFCLVSCLLLSPCPGTIIRDLAARGFRFRVQTSRDRQTITILSSRTMSEQQERNHQQATQAVSVATVCPFRALSRPPDRPSHPDHHHHPPHHHCLRTKPSQSLSHFTIQFSRLGPAIILALLTLSLSHISAIVLFFFTHLTLSKSFPNISFRESGHRFFPVPP